MIKVIVASVAALTLGFQLGGGGTEGNPVPPPKVVTKTKTVTETKIVTKKVAQVPQECKEYIDLMKRSQEAASVIEAGSEQTFDFISDARAALAGHDILMLNQVQNRYNHLSQKTIDAIQAISELSLEIEPTKLQCEGKMK